MSGKLIGRVYGEFGGSRPQQHVLLAYAESADDDGTNCRPSVSRIAYETGLEVRRVKQIVSELRALKVMELVREAAGRRPPEYRICLEEGPRKETFQEWKSARGMRVGVQLTPPLEESAGVQSRGVGVQYEDTPESVGVQSRTPGVQFEDGGVQFRDRRGATSTTQPIDPSTTRSNDPEESAREPEGELRYLNDETRRCVEALTSIKNWDKDPAKTITLVSEAMKTYPMVDVLQTGTNLAYKIRVGTYSCKKPSKAFSNWVVMDEERRRKNARAPGRRAVNSTAVVGATEEDFDGDF